MTSNRLDRVLHVPAEIHLQLNESLAWVKTPSFGLAGCRIESR